MLGHFGDSLRERVARFFSGRVNPRYGTSFEIGPISFETADEPPADQILPGGTPLTAGLTVTLDRRVLLRILECRYGRQGASRAGGGDASDMPTASERRIASQLGAEMLALLAEHIGGLSVGVPDAPASGTTTRSRAVLHGVFRIDDVARGDASQLRFTLDWRWQTPVFAALSSANKRAKPRELKPDLRNRVSVTLRARLLEVNMPLDELFALRAGAVVPVPGNLRAQVLIGPTPVFTAKIADRDGRLCVAAFEDME
ncbi:FliM/FliN family flagellar motor C-terminal domain-containing protein [Burkholderia ubonensis]|uniref:FliM/FliN family flagellar motor C-terminal domain-containing protein n=1 Tax=Burkholderia ubonensis TaxID=101571 RepID=UPI00076DA338|nr:flagellar motor switch protein FliM [Burkholderia ubonensis]KWB79404.1 hypothetical protein WL42_12645 [Burkholderia ubonensis]